MDGLSKWKAAIYLAAIFAAGTVSGWVVATKAARQKAYSAPRSDEIAASLRTCMYDRLKLTDGQKQKIDTVIERSAKEMQSIHRERTDRIRLSLSNRNSQIMGILTLEQQAEFELIEKERRESWRQKDGARNKRGSRDGKKTSKDKTGDSETTNGVPNSATNPDWLPVFSPTATP
jgi:Spy/CpxP family protein refolding chaperone